MYFDENMQNYLDSLLAVQNNSTDELYDKQKKDKRPIIKKDIAQFLKLIVKLTLPVNLLEIGTNCGFSAICLAQEMSADSKLTSIEINRENAEIARATIKTFCPQKNIEIIHGDAVKLLVQLPKDLDLVFIDADKLNYQLYLDFAASNLKKGGIVLMDNLLWKGRVVEVQPDETPSTTFLRNFNLAFMQDYRFISNILPIGDGLGMAVKK